LPIRPKVSLIRLPLDSSIIANLRMGLSISVNSTQLVVVTATGDVTISYRYVKYANVFVRILFVQWWTVTDY
jgi:hypothetical protein